MTIRIATNPRNDCLDAINARANAGSGAAMLRVYSGSQPATANTAASGTLLATFTMADPCFETPVSGAMDFDANPDITCVAAASGTAGYARLVDSDGNAVLDGSVGTSGTDFLVNTTSVISGQTLTFVAATLNFPV